ncbi:conjugative transposon protein TraM [Bacteroidia bacterium]|nr:conjugative transposon protein TraM [Bacteroidia bacterium]
MNTNNQSNEEKPKLTVEQKQKMKKYAVFALMGIICAGCIWFIFAPSTDEKDTQKAQAGFNTDIPMPKEEGLIGDKRDAYEQEQMKEKQSERMRSLQDFSRLLGNNSPETDDLALTDEPPAPKATGGYVPSRSQSSIEQSAQAYHDVNRTLGSFYEKPKEDPEKEKLKQELEDLKARMDESENRKKSTDEQMALMEKSFQMAAKYMPGAVGTSAAQSANVNDTEPAQANTNKNVSGKITVASVRQAREHIVSSLQPEMSSAEFIETFSVPRNMGFITATNEANTGIKNTIFACIHEDKTVTDGQNVRLRLLESMQVGNVFIPHNTLLSGTAKIQGERIGITINFLEYNGSIVPVELTVYDMDGQAGIFIPNLQELNAAKEIAANMGTNAGTSINLSNDAGKQFAADMGRNLIQGVSQFFSKKIREVKVHLKAGYKVFLLPDGNLKNQQHLANNQ